MKHNVYCGNIERIEFLSKLGLYFDMFLQLKFLYLQVHFTVLQFRRVHFTTSYQSTRRNSGSSRSRFSQIALIAYSGRR